MAHERLHHSILCTKTFPLYHNRIITSRNKAEEISWEEMTTFYFDLLRDTAFNALSHVRHNDENLLENSQAMNIARAMKCDRGGDLWEGKL